MKRKSIVSMLVILVVGIAFTLNVFAFNGGCFVPYKNQKQFEMSQWFKEATKKIKLKSYEDLGQEEKRYYLFSLILQVIENTGNETSADNEDLTIFKDIATVSDNDLESVKKLRKLGILDGRLNEEGEVELKFNECITRAEVAKIIATYHQKFFYVEKERECTFKDIENSWAAEYIKYCYERNLFDGKSIYEFDPESNITKEEVITIFLNLASETNIEEEVSMALNQVYCITTKYNEDGKGSRNVKRITPEDSFYTVKNGKEVTIKVKYDPNKNLRVDNTKGNISIQKQEINGGSAVIKVKGNINGAGLLEFYYIGSYYDKVYVPIFVYTDKKYCQEVRKITVSEDVINLSVDDTYSLKKNVKTSPSDCNVYYVSEDTDVASVNFSTGLITAKKKGSTKILLLSNGVTKELKLVVKKDIWKEDKYYKDIRLSEDSGEFYIGETFDISELVKNVSDRKVTYYSENDNIATVDKYGNVCIKGSGKTWVKIKCDGVTVKYKVTATKKDEEEESIKDISFKKSTIEVTQKMKVDIKDFYDVLPSSNSKETAVYSSYNENIAVIDKDGYITGVTCGDTIISVRIGRVEKSVKVKVVDGITNTPIPRIVFYSDDITLKLGMDFNVYSLLGNSYGKDITLTLSDKTVAKLEENKVITLSRGETILTAKDNKTGDFANLLIKVE